jgi:hypothetical protein
LIDLDHTWIHFDLREDLVKKLEGRDRHVVRIPALGDRRVTVEVKLIATKGEYASWSATRASGDFDLRTCSVRAYPVVKVSELRPGMSAYVYWEKGRCKDPGPCWSSRTNSGCSLFCACVRSRAARRVQHQNQSLRRSMANCATPAAPFSPSGGAYFPSTVQAIRAGLMRERRPRFQRRILRRDRCHDCGQHSLARS